MCDSMNEAGTMPAQTPRKHKEWVFKVHDVLEICAQISA